MAWISKASLSLHGFSTYLSLGLYHDKNSSAIIFQINRINLDVYICLVRVQNIYKNFKCFLITFTDV